jgi:hypothetical protein
LSVRKLPKVGLVYVIEVGLEVAIHRRQWFKAIVSKRYRLSVLKFRKRLHIKSEVPLLAVGLGGADVSLVGERLACEIADFGIVAAL